ncbi:UNVERIFIED_CONTAM: hypothetical protein Slati_0500600 [Sesamum latifolium]|uniref:Uncharacterized protein n=1 Tax=Sesamum latifolium TaxID=2727402 RepID=A0AAW2XX82_9LAMI
MDLQYPQSPTPPFRWLELRGRLLKVPEWIPSLQGLTGLHLRWSKINEDPTESLQHLPNLRFLELDLAYEDMSETFIQTLEKQKEEGGNWKLAHIPKIGIYS